jgi:uncharacterized protein YndB with AHSA1/START domain
MTPAKPSASTRTSRLINAPREAIYRAFTDPAALVVWQAPGEMTGKVHEFDLRVGGGYRMSLFYPATEEGMRGKTAAREDRYTARFVELAPRRIAQAIAFETADPAVAGGTEVTIAFENIPAGVRPEDNDAGTRSSLEKLARYVE